MSFKASAYTRDGAPSSVLSEPLSMIDLYASIASIDLDAYLNKEGKKNERVSTVVKAD